jgi:site-specific recombinase XerD
MADLYYSGDLRPVSTGAATSRFGPSSDLLPLFMLRFDREQTQRAYRNDLTSFFERDTVTLADAQAVSFVEVNEYLARLEREGYKPSTIQRRLAAVRSFYGWLLALSLVSSNPADRHVVRRIRQVKSTERTVAVLTAEQARALVDAPDLNRPGGLRDQTMLLTMLHLVLRRSEVAQMDREHLRRLSGHWILDIPAAKGGMDQTVKVPPHVAEALIGMWGEYGIAGGAAWRQVRKNGSVGGRLSARSVYGIVRRAVDEANRNAVASPLANVPHIGAHTLRHTGCTLAIEGGATPQQVQAHARHKKLETTMVYVHQRDRLADNASDYIDF